MNRTKTSKNHDITTETLRDDIESLREDVRGLATDARLYTRQKVNGLTENVRGTANEAIERGREAVGTEYDRALDYVRQNPLAAVSFGVVIGVALGAMFRGRH